MNHELLHDLGTVMNHSVFYFHEKKENLSLIRLLGGSKEADHKKIQTTQPFLSYNLTDATLVQALMTSIFVK